MEACVKLNGKRITRNIHQHIQSPFIRQPRFIVARSGSRWCRVSKVLADMTPVMTDQELFLHCCALVKHADERSTWALWSICPNISSLSSPVQTQGGPSLTHPGLSLSPPMLH